MSERSAFAGASLSAAERVAAQIELRVRRGDGQAGQRLGTKSSLAEQCDVAPATFAEGLRLLRERGLVEVRPGPRGGVFAITPTPMYEMARQVLALRHDEATVGQVVGVLDALDDAVCRDAAEHRTTQDVADLEVLVESLATSWAESIETIRLNWALHRRIAEITPNLVLRVFYLNLVDYIESEGFDVEPEMPLGSRHFHPFAGDRLAVHRDLVTAIAEGSLPDVAAALRRHREQPDAVVVASR